MIQLIVHKKMLIFATDCFSNGFVRCDGKRIMDEYQVIGTKYCSHCKLRVASSFRHVTMFPSMPGCLRLLCDACARLPNVPVHCSCGSTDVKVSNLIMSTLAFQDYLCEQCLKGITQPAVIWKRRRERMFFGKRQVAAYIYDSSTV